MFLFLDQSLCRSKMKLRQSGSRNQSSISFADHSLICNQSLMHQFKVKIYCGLHLPAGFYYLYHLVLLLMLFINCFCLNMALDFGMADVKRRQLTHIIAFWDTTLLTILVIEWILRLFVVNCNVNYDLMHALLRHLRRNAISRINDGFCTTLLTFLVIAGPISNRPIAATIRILHFLLLFQAYRIFSPTLKHFISVVQENATLLVMAMVLYTIVLTVATYSIYIFELYCNDSISSLFDAAWFSFISLTTIGYGDVEITLPISKLFIAAFVLCGYTVFSLPSSIIGSAVALRLQDSRQKILCLNPAANLIQRTWRYYAILHIDQYWLRMVLSRQGHNQGRRLTRKDEYVIFFIFKVAFLLAQNRFKYSSLVHNTGSVPLQYAQLQRKIELINKAVGKHNFDLNQIKFQLKKIVSDLKKCQANVDRLAALGLPRNLALVR